MSSTRAIPAWAGWWAAAVVLILVLTGMWFFARDGYIALGTEDAVGENATALFYGVAAILLWIVAARRIARDRGAWKKQILTVLLGGFFFFIAGEEISWGQRLLGFEVPDTVRSHNVQSEFNFHNLQVFDRHRAIISQHAILNLFAVMMGVMIPLAYRYSPAGRRLLDRVGFPVVPLSLSGFFVLGLVHTKGIQKFEPHWAHTEVKELVFSIGFFLFAVLALIAAREREPAPTAERVEAPG